MLNNLIGAEITVYREYESSGSFRHECYRGILFIDGSGFYLKASDKDIPIISGDQVWRRDMDAYVCTVC